ncbi:xanthine dehydrogenase family protein molybdopterin-binding subunit [Streptomyces sp. NPDC002573]|uniref:xanthine dehydrogenase family protein molybdopterin-binding subunit n=1 Tax=Streptomyces sp. NPDC002573 TaxID=3364651 RepID=UPI0036C44176
MEKWARREDERLLTGKGRYVADIRVPGCLDAAFVRSPVAHGVLREVDCTAARAVPGVAGAWSAADLPELPPVPNTLLAMLSTEEAVAGREWPALVKDRVRYPGEALAVVLGEDRYRAEDGVAEVTVTIDPLPAVVTPSAALEDEVRLFDGLSNVVLRGEAGEPVEESVRSVLTNTMVIYPYRGAGRPEAAIAIERSIDLLARRLGMDPVELRRRNFIPPDAFPYETPVGRVYDSGNYAAALDLALEALDHDRWRAEQARRRKDPDAFPLGIGVSCYVERSGGETGGLHEFGSLQAGEDGKITARCGTAPSGQGHETVFPALIAGFLGVPETQVRLVEGDTDEQPEGLGSFASRSAQIDGALFRHLADLLIDEARTRAAGLWDLPVDRIEWTDGSVHTAHDGTPLMGLGELVKHTGPLRVEDRFESSQAFPFGAHAAVVEVDVDLGTVHILRLVAVDDCGVILSPAVVHGQAYGSVLQGVGQALYEGMRFDDDGVPHLAGGFLDYLLPTFTEVPPIDVKDTHTPSPNSPLGAKGAGESGCIGTPAAVVNAVADALPNVDPGLLQMPLTPDSILRALRASANEEGVR